MGERLTGTRGHYLQIFAALARARALGFDLHERGSPWAKEFVEHDAHLLKMGLIASAIAECLCAPTRQRCDGLEMRI